MSSITETLERDHKFINKVVAAMAFLADERLADGKAVDTKMLRDLVRFAGSTEKDKRIRVEVRHFLPLLFARSPLHTALLQRPSRLKALARVVSTDLAPGPGTLLWIPGSTCAAIQRFWAYTASSIRNSIDISLTWRI